MRVWIFVTGLACVACGGPSNERLLTEEDFGDDWPFTVAAGTVRCVQNAVTFDADGVTYAVNGRASASGQAVPIEPIWKTATLPMTSPPVQRLDEPSRRRIFRHIVACEDAAAKQAQAEFPETDAGHPDFSMDRFAELFEKETARENELTESCKVELRNEESLSDDEMSRISIEGVTQNWPSLSITRKSIHPIIKSGLELCE